MGALWGLSRGRTRVIRWIWANELMDVLDILIQFERNIHDQLNWLT